MKCPACNANIPKKAEFCPECAHQLTPEEKETLQKKGKLLWFVLGPVLALFLGFAIFIFFAAFVSSSYELVEIDIPSENIDFGAAIPVDISVEADGMLAKTFEIPVYIDSILVHTFAVDYEGGKMGEITTINQSAEIICDAASDPGQHTASINDLSDSFNVFTAPIFTFRSDADEYYYITNYPFSVDCIIANTGETGGNCDYTALFDDEVIDEGAVAIAGQSEKKFDVSVSANTDGFHTFKFGGKTYDMPFYNTFRPQTGKLMENTVKGYGYIDFDNQTANDMVVYITPSDDSSTAVVARYIRAGEKHKIDSIVHGEYDIYIQIGNEFVPKYNEFYFDQKTYFFASFELNTNVVNGAGVIYYIPIKMTQSEFDSRKYPVDFIPLIPDNM